MIFLRYRGNNLNRSSSKNQNAFINDNLWPRPGLRGFVVIILLGVLLVTFCLSLAFGSVKIPLPGIIAILLGSDVEKATWTDIILKFRLPKALTALLAGAALAVSGLQMQTLFRNPLADPYVLGVSSGASLGVALVILATGIPSVTSWTGLFSNFSVLAGSSLGAAAALGLVLVISRKVQNSVTLLLLGLMFGYLALSIVSILIYFSEPEQIQSYLIWTFGSFGRVTWNQVKILAPTIISGLFMAQFSAKSLNALLLGENYAQSLGLTIKKARFWIIIGVSVLAGAVTAFCGPISFLGIAVPHICRNLLNTSDHRLLIPMVAVVGATLALLFDLVAQVPGSQTTLPLNAVTSLLGAPVVIWIIIRQRNLKASFGS